MLFCETCGNILIVKNAKLFCRKCNVSTELTEEIVFDQLQEEEKQIVIFDEKEDKEFPVTKILCPKCDEEVEAYWTMQQTRGADEPPTRFYRCKICNHVWREYS